VIFVSWKSLPRVCENVASGMNAVVNKMSAFTPGRERKPFVQLIYIDIDTAVILSVSEGSSIARKPTLGRRDSSLLSE
jgi:hypothetical protein